MAYKYNPKTVERNMKFNRATYDRIEVLVKKGEREKVQARAEELGKSVNGYITGLIYTDMEKGPGQEEP